jgi:hypothetical protein
VVLFVKPCTRAPRDKIFRYQTTINRPLYQAINSRDCSGFGKGDNVPATTQGAGITRPPTISEAENTDRQVRGVNCENRAIVCEAFPLAGSDSDKKHDAKLPKQLLGRRRFSLSVLFGNCRQPLADQPREAHRASRSIPGGPGASSFSPPEQS